MSLSHSANTHYLGPDYRAKEAKMKESSANLGRCRSRMAAGSSPARFGECMRMQDEGLSISKRKALFAFLTLLPPMFKPDWAGATALRSLNSKRPSIITFSNQTNRHLKLYWNNYDADKEFFARIPPAGQYTVDTWASHPWSVVDAETGSLVKEVVAEEGLQSIPIGAVDSPIVRADAQDEAQPIAAFDGLGGPRESYTPVQIAEVRFDNNGAVVALKADGFQELLAIAIGPAEAFALYRTFGPETRRPSTLKTWQHSLDAVGVKVERIVLTRLVGSTYYSRVVLKQAEQVTSIDSRPSDSLALALQSKSPIFASKELMRVNDEETALAKALQENQGPEIRGFPQERGEREFQGPELPSDPEMGGAFSA